ncbi:hypothetical protein F5Y06DRAFT_302842 [Hypoxylon sp. FL0890]|nr:hypothetical protein F5Y06DRAFT_302842 [Hypoxylon sp. FL0890]
MASSSGNNPTTPTPNPPRGPAQLRAAGRGQTLIPSPVRGRLPGSASSRQLSAGFVSGGGPLSSHPTTASSNLAASGSRGTFDRTAPGPLRASQTTNAFPPLSPRKDGGRRRSLVPVPTTPTTTMATKADASVLSRFKAENIPPSGSLASLAGKHKDSLDLPSTRSVPRRVSPCPTERDSEPDKSLQLRRVPSPPPFELLKDSEDESLQLRRVQRVSSPVPSDTKQKGPPQTPTQIPRPIQKESAKKGPGIPKSRTFNTFSSLTQSLSRVNLSNFGRHDSRRPAAANMEDQKNDVTSTPSGASTALAPMPTQPATPTPAPSGLSYSANDPRLIHTAQSSAYWTGRYMSLRDKFMNEMLQPQNLKTILTADAERSKVPVSVAPKPSASAGLPTSSTMAYLPQRPSETDKTATMKAAENLTDEDKRDRRIFMHLEGLCTTDEARNSLYSFQEDYARRSKKEWLLPPRSAMDPKDKGKGKGWVGRMFSGGKDGGKKSGGSGQ